MTATEMYAKWVEAIPLKKVTGPVVTNFIKEHIICDFGILKIILSEYGTLFINRDIRNLTERYRVKHYKSSPHYPKGNGQAEATNKALINILSKTLNDHMKTWAKQLPIALWAYKTSKRKPTDETPYALMYGKKTVLLAEIEILLAKIKL